MVEFTRCRRPNLNETLKEYKKKYSVVLESWHYPHNSLEIHKPNPTQPEPCSYHMKDRHIHKT